MHVTAVVTERNVHMKEKMLEGFKNTYGNGGEVRVYFAPGRVNLIGEYTDFNGGHVFPCALTMGTYAAVRKRDDRKLRFCSANFEMIGIIEGSLDDLVYDRKNKWANYCLGVVKSFEEMKGISLDRGFDFYCFGNIPNGAGLSSSASIEVLTAKALIDLYDLDVNMIDAALIGQHAERSFVGMNCGIMDQFAIAMGKKGHAIFLDTATLDYKYVPVKLDGMKIVIGNTNKKRKLTDSKYNERRAECEAALAKIRTQKPIEALCELDCEEFDSLRHVIGDEINDKRAEHAVYENVRTIRAVEALEAGDVAAFGKLMNESHVSLANRLEVSCEELNTLVESAWRQEGTVGARMTGAGFGGCMVAIVREECVKDYIAKVGAEYLEKIGYEASFYTADIGDGPVEL